MLATLIHNAAIVNEGSARRGSVLVEGERIARVLSVDEGTLLRVDRTIDATGCYLLPGVIDEHVHFRDPGLTDKADVASESRAAAAGGVTSVMDMPNTKPQTTTLEALEGKLELMSRTSRVNYSAYFGATNDNCRLLSLLPRHRVCGVKLFMGSSTGNMLVDGEESLLRVFGGTDLLIAAHCEEPSLIAANISRYKQELGASDDLPLSYHPLVRSREACLRSSALAVSLARRTGARLHLLHLSTADELSLLTQGPVESKRITAEACVAHLYFSEADYPRLGSRIKCNPAIKSAADRDALRQAVASGLIDTIATDHAPHLLGDKAGGALRAASGMPSVQYSLVLMLQLADLGLWTMETVVERMCHAPARLYHVERRGFIREGYFADLTLVRHTPPSPLPPPLSKCGWTPFADEQVNYRVERTIVNGQTVYADGKVNEAVRGRSLTFE